MKVLRNMSEKLFLEDMKLSTECDDLELKDDPVCCDDEETCKEGEEHRDEAEKEMDAARKAADEINDAESVAPKFKDGSGKSLAKLKLVSEQLTLSESDDLEEQIPPDLMDTYKKARFKGNGPAADLNKADYREVTPEEAKSYIKNGGSVQDVNLIIDGKLIKLADNAANGSKEPKFRSTIYSSDKKYHKKNGDTLSDTGYIPSKHLLNVADKIYITNEASPEGQKDPSMLAARAENPESPRFNTRSQLGNRDLIGNYRQRRGDWVDVQKDKDKRDYWVSRKQAQDNVIRWDNAIRDLKARYEAGELSKSEYESKLDSFNARKRDAIADRDDYFDSMARTRYARSELTLQNVFVKFKELSSQIKSARRKVEREAERVDSVKQYGAPENARNRRELEDLKNRLRDIQRQIAEHEFDLEDSDELDAKALENAQKIYDNAVANLENIYAQLKSFKRKGESLLPKGKKLTLSEDFEVVPQEGLPQQLPTEESFGISTLLSQLVQSEWDAVDTYNSALVTIKSLCPNGSTEAISTINEILNEEYVHIGQLEKLLQSLNPTANSIEVGKEHDETSNELQSTTGLLPNEQTNEQPVVIVVQSGHDHEHDHEHHEEHDHHEHHEEHEEVHEQNSLNTNNSEQGDLDSEGVKEI